MAAQSGVAIVAYLRNPALAHELESIQSMRMRSMARDAARGLRVCRLPARQEQVIVTVRRAAGIGSALQNILMAFETRIITERIQSDGGVMVRPAQICHQILGTLGQTFRPTQDPAATVTVDTGRFLVRVKGRERA